MAWATKWQNTKHNKSSNNNVCSSSWHARHDLAHIFARFPGSCHHRSFSQWPDSVPRPDIVYFCPMLFIYVNGVLPLKDFQKFFYQRFSSNKVSITHKNENKYIFLNSCLVATLRALSSSCLSITKETSLGSVKMFGRGGMWRRTEQWYHYAFYKTILWVTQTTLLQCEKINIFVHLVKLQKFI